MSKEFNHDIHKNGDAIPSVSVQQGFSDEITPLLRLIGQIAAMYLVAEGPDGLYLIDQHAAHERVLFEKMMKHKPERIPVQTLVNPATVDISPA